jgi:hypothetical protein
MAKGFKKGVGGANPLNFKVVGGTSEPTNTKENTVWINTDQKITSWMFSATEPENPAEGMVWIKIALTSGISFNALKKNGIQVYPFMAFQWIESVWVQKTAKVHQGESWEDWFVHLFYNGDTCDAVTGGYEEVSDHITSTASASSSVSDTIYVYVVEGATGYAAAIGRTVGKTVDLTNVRTIRAIGNCLQAHAPVEGHTGHSQVGIRVVASKSLNNDHIVADVNTRTVGKFELELDVSDLSGSYYVIPYAFSYSNYKAEGEFTEIRYH